MTAATYDLVIDQGSDFALDLVVKQSGSALNLANYSGRAQLRTSHSSSSIAATFTVTVTNAANGALKMQLPGSTSKNIAAGQYVYDLEIFTANDAAVTRLIQGKVQVIRGITR